MEKLFSATVLMMFSSRILVMCALPATFTLAIRTSNYQSISTCQQDIRLLWILLTAVGIRVLLFILSTIFSMDIKQRMRDIIDSFRQFRITLSFGLSIVFFGFGIWVLFQQDAPFVASFSFLVAWLLSSRDLYPNIAITNQGWLKNIAPGIFLAFGYFIVWIGFFLMIERASLLGITYIYGVGLIFAFSANFGRFNPRLRSRLSDDVFLLAVALTIYATLRMFFPFGDEQITLSSGLLRSIISISEIQYIFANLSFNLLASSELSGSILFVLDCSALVELYVYSILLILIILSRKDCNRPIRKISDDVFKIGADVLGVFIIGYELGQVLNALSIGESSLAIENSIIHLIIATVAAFILLLSRRTPRVIENIFIPDVQDSIHIDTSPAEILHVLLDIENAPRCTPNLRSVSNIKGRGEGCTYNFLYEIGPIPIRIIGLTEIIRITANSFEMVTTGKFPSKWIWELKQSERGTTVMLSVGYKMSSLLKRTLLNYNQKIVKQTLLQLQQWIGMSARN